MKIYIGRLPSKTTAIKTLKETAEYIRNLPFEPSKLTIEIDGWGDC